MEMLSRFVAGAPIIASSPEVDIWEKVLTAKKAFIYDGIVPEPTKYLPAEIIKSWIIAKDNGIDRKRPWPPATLCDEEVRVLLEENQVMIEATAPFFESYNEILSQYNYNMLLYDSNGVILKYARKQPDESIAVGGIRSEREVGTTAHNLAGRFKRVVQIIGPVNYCKHLENNVTTSAPILNEYGELLGTIVLYQIVASDLWHLGHNLGWITSTAVAISSQLKVLRRDTRLKVMDHTIKKALEDTKEAFISVDRKGHIINFNKEAGRLMHIKGDKADGSIFSMVTDPSPIKKAIDKGRWVKNTKITFLLAPTSPIDAEIQPFSDGEHTSGAVIKVRNPLIDKKPAKKEQVTFNSIVRKSEIMENLINSAKVIATKPVNVLLLGESGTGKELFARAMHSEYGNGPFVVINCASIPANLIESELFGYEKGAFTGASKEGKKGKIEHANGGTLFLDEIGDMPLELQPVLLRVLEEKKITRVGGHVSIPVDFRIISATNKPLLDCVADNTFRGDLYYRLSVISIELPPLRQRGENVVVLAEKFVENICMDFELPKYELLPDAKKIILDYSWPGNIRQLRNAMTYAVSFAKDNEIKAENLPKEVIYSVPVARHSMKEVRKLEHKVLKETIQRAGTMEKAAKKLGISRSTLYRRLKDAES